MKPRLPRTQRHPQLHLIRRMGKVGYANLRTICGAFNTALSALWVCMLKCLYRPEEKNRERSVGVSPLHLLGGLPILHKWTRSAPVWHMLCCWSFFPAVLR